MAHARRLEPEHHRSSAGRSRRRARPVAAAHPDSRCWPGARRRLRQRRQPDTVAGSSTSTRDRDPRGYRRIPAPCRATAADRERAAGVVGRDPGNHRCLANACASESVLPPDTPRLFETDVNLRALLFTGAISLFTGCAFGLVPMLNALRIRLRAVVDSGGRSDGPTVAGPVRSALTIAQVACAVLLVVAAGLLVRSLWSLSRANPGFRAAEVVTARISPPDSVCGSRGSLPGLLPRAR